MVTDKISIRAKQAEVAMKMINPDSGLQSDWKFLICDSVGEDILTPLFSVKDLKYYRITLRLPIDSIRDPVPDVSAIYFVIPTDENIERICRDLTDHLYDSYYFNFISPLSKSKLETIAKASLLSDSATNVKKVYEPYLNSIALEDDLFILRESEKNMVSYYAINRNDATDAEITAVIDYIVECIFSLLVSMNIIPIIRCPKGGASEFIAEKLTKRIRETLKDSRNNLFSIKNNINLIRESKTTTNTIPNTLGVSLQRPLLCLVDRTIDMSTPLHHTWTYQALIHDLLNTELNKVKLIEDETKPKLQVFDLNPNDKFWREQRGSPFPQVADAVQLELDKYKKHEDELTKGLSGPDDELGMLSESAIKTTGCSLPELRENKRLIEKHTSIAAAVLEEIKSRKLDNFFEFEEKIMNRNPIDRVTFDDMISNPDYGLVSDKYRLFLIAYICDNPSISEKEADIYMKVLEDLGCQRTAFDYVRNWKAFSKTNVTNLQSSLKSSSGVLKTAGMFTKLMSQSSQFVMSGVKNLVLKEHYLPLTKIVDGLMDSSSKISREAKEYTYLDPKTENEREIQRKRVFNEAIVFVVGGGNYIEYQNLVEYCDSKSRPYATKHVIYGSTDLMNATQFLEQLQLVGGS